MSPIDPAAWPPALSVAVLALAVHRVTRLLVADKISEPVRALIGQRRSGVSRGVYTEFPEPRPWLGYLVTCPWCVSVYVATAAVLAAGLLPWHWVAWPALAAAFSSVAGLLSAHEEPA